MAIRETAEGQQSVAVTGEAAGPSSVRVTAPAAPSRTRPIPGVPLELSGGGANSELSEPLDLDAYVAGCRVEPIAHPDEVAATPPQGTYLVCGMSTVRHFPAVQCSLIGASAISARHFSSMAIRIKGDVLRAKATLPKA
jgi:hypothetical protein